MFKCVFLVSNFYWIVVCVISPLGIYWGFSFWSIFLMFYFVFKNDAFILFRGNISVVKKKICFYLLQFFWTVPYLFERNLPIGHSSWECGVEEIESMADFLCWQTPSPTTPCSIFEVEMALEADLILWDGQLVSTAPCLILPVSV